MKNQKGITLIALVVTVIVLLILAGVSISLLIGDSGIFTSTRYSIEQDEKGKVEEEVKLAISTAEIEYYKDFVQDNSIGKGRYFGDGAFYEANCKGAKIKANGKPDVAVIKGSGVSDNSDVGDITVKYRTESNVLYIVKFRLEDPSNIIVTP